MSNPPTRYRVLESLGKGGMGEVFLADDTQLDRKVALKFLPETLERDPHARARFEREAKSAAALDHPYICKIFEVGEVDGRVCIAMEQVVGETLLDRLAREPLTLTDALRIGAEIAEALEEAHKRHIVHRDLKPANIMLTEQGHVKVMDFGLAKRVAALGAAAETAATEADGLTQFGTAVGTPAYMAPEQVRGEAVDARSDLFSFGTVLYEMLTGAHPFGRDTPVETMSAILRDEPSASGAAFAAVPDLGKTALRKMLAKTTGARYQTAKELRGDLARVSESASQQGRVAEAVAKAPAGARGGRRTAFVGRRAELEQLQRALAAAIEGTGSHVLLGGEPGVGKTRLTEELMAEARRRGCLTLTGHCYEMEGTPPFMPFVEILERSAKIIPRTAFREALGDAAPEIAKIMPELRTIFPDIPAPVDLPPDQQRRFLFNAYQSFVERSASVVPIVTVLEDLHWADEPTLQLIHHQAQRTATMPLLWVGTYRDVELDVARPFARTLEDLLRERLASRIALRRLPESDVERLLEALAGQTPPNGLATAIHYETEGNPFFVEEVFQHLSEEGRLFDDEGRWRSDLDLERLRVPEGVRLSSGGVWRG